MKKPKPSSVPWLIGGTLLINTLIQLLYTGGGRISQGKVSNMFWIESAALFICGWIPWIRYLSLLISVPVLFYNVMTKLPALLNLFNNYMNYQKASQDKRGIVQSGKSI